MFHDESLKHMLSDHQGQIIKISRFKIQDSLFKNSGAHMRNKSK